MDTEEQEWVSHTLKEYERKQCISKVLSMNCNNAVAKGNNYGSDMKRLNLKLVLNSGEVVNRPVIFKMLPKTELRRQLIKPAQFIESKMLRDILPKIEGIRSNVDRTVERISPICYGIQSGYEGILLEDLTVLGFKMADRKKGLDFQHAELVVNSLAEFHAATKVLIERGDILINEFSMTIFDWIGKEMDAAFINGLDCLIKTIEEKWQGQWVHYGSKLKEMCGTIKTRLREVVRIDQKNFNTLIHGDCWTTNMMFKYKDGQPHQIRLLDFQVSQYNNVCLDLTHFFHSSLSLDALPRWQELLKIYSNKLSASLSLYGYSGSIPSYEDIAECYERASLWGFAVGVAFRPHAMKSEDDIPDDLEEWTKEFRSDNGMKAEHLEGEEVQTFMSYILKNFFK